MKKESGTTKNKKLFAGALGGSTEEKGAATVSTSDSPSTSGYLQSRTNALSKVAAGTHVMRSLHNVLPERCKIWVHHNRRYELLNEDRCRDLIEGIKAQGRQEFPAIVRAIKDDPNFDYEIICGARRHWTITWLRQHHYDYKYLVEVRDLSDEEAFRLSDIENRDREDISDFERAVDYARALELYYNTQQEMADRLEVKKDWLSRFLQLAELPSELVNAYADVRDIKVKHMRDLGPAIKIQNARKLLIAKANEISEMQRSAKAAGKDSFDGSSVLKLLLSVLKPAKKTKQPAPQRFVAKSSGKTMLEATAKKGGLVMTVSMQSKPTREELLTAATEVIDQLFSAPE